MDIAAMSISMAQARVQQQASLSITKKAMDMSEIQMQGIIEMMQTVSPDSPGQVLDVKA